MTAFAIDTPRAEPPVRRYGTALFAAAAAVAFALAMIAPLLVTVVGLALFGLPHTALETRYVVGRFAPRFGPRALAWWLAPITIVVIARLVRFGPAKQVEIGVAVAVAIAAWIWATRGSPWLMVSGAVVLAVLGFASLAAIAWFVVLVAFLHNLTPVPFLWEWSPPRRVGFRLVHLIWAVAVPALILSGACDGLLSHAAGWAVSGAGTTTDVAALYTPPPLLSGPWPLRFLATFAFLQTMHYVVWCAFVPAATAEESQAAARVGPLAPLWRRPPFLVVVAVAAAVATTLFVLDYTTARWMYGAIASYHAYVEFPVLAVLAATALGAGPAIRRRQET
ncbi:MAG: hypothetical protein K1X95_07000 [Acidimicrobiia bacterium]|nr:hypothetical protein [Acidimicrobiia bacterium]